MCIRDSYKAGDQAQALATLDRFIKLHPASPALDYALYLKGIVNFNDNLGLFSNITKQDLSERDQKAAKESFESFKELVARFPESRYASDASARMTYIVNSLAQYEVHVAVVVQGRLRAVDGGHVRAAAVVVARDDTRRVLQQNYPKSQYLSGDQKQGAPWYKFW